MSKISSGVYQLPNGMWGFRYAFMLDGKQKDIKRTKDENLSELSIMYLQMVCASRLSFLAE